MIIVIDLNYCSTYAVPSSHKTIINCLVRQSAKFNYAIKLEPWKEAPWKNDSFIIPLNDFALLSFFGSALIANVEALYASAATCENNICAICFKNSS